MADILFGAQWVKFYFANDYDQYLFFNDLYFDERQIAKIIWDLEENNTMVEVMKSFNILEGCSIYIRSDIKQKIVSFHFGTSKKHIMKRLFLGDEQVFKNFIYQFFAEMSEYLKNSDYFFSDNVRNNVSLYLNKKDRELEYKKAAKKLRPKYIRVSFNEVKQRLSQRELQCLSLLAQAKTAKEIGVLLEISPRTVESYLQDVKNKFNINNRSELVDLHEAIERIILPH